VILTKITYIIEHPNIIKKREAANTRKLGTLHTEKWNVKRLDVRLCSASPLGSTSLLLADSILEWYKIPMKLLRNNAPDKIRNVFLQ